MWRTKLLLRTVRGSLLESIPKSLNTKEKRGGKRKEGQEKVRGGAFGERGTGEGEGGTVSITPGFSIG